MTVPAKNLAIRLILQLFIVSVYSNSLYAGADNIARQAKVTVSSELNNNFKANGVNDGIIGIHNKGEWACEGQTAVWGYIRYPWVQLDWTSAQSIEATVDISKGGKPTLQQNSGY